MVSVFFLIMSNKFLILRISLRKFVSWKIWNLQLSNWFIFYCFISILEVDFERSCSHWNIISYVWTNINEKNVEYVCSSLFLNDNIFIFFFYQDFLSQTLTSHRTAGEGGDHLLFHSTISTRSRTFRHLFATLHVR